jgi:hypothetical protein
VVTTVTTTVDGTELGKSVVVLTITIDGCDGIVMISFVGIVDTI